MSTISKVSYHAVCDSCGEEMDDDGEGWGDTPGQAVEIAVDAGWTKDDSGRGRLLCGGCVDDDADLVNEEPEESILSLARHTLKPVPELDAWLERKGVVSDRAGFDLAAERCGIEVVAQSEIDSQACKLLAQKFPEALQLGDITKVSEEVLHGLEGLRGVVRVALAQVGTTCRRPSNITDTRGRVGHPCGEPAKCLPCALAELEGKG